MNEASAKTSYGRPDPEPSSVGRERSPGYMLSGDNLSDDLFMFLKHDLNSDQGILPGQKYRIEYAIINSICKRLDCGSAALERFKGKERFALRNSRQCHNGSTRVKVLVEL